MELKVYVYWTPFKWIGLITMRWKGWLKLKQDVTQLRIIVFNVGQKQDMKQDN